MDNFDLRAFISEGKLQKNLQAKQLEESTESSISEEKSVNINLKEVLKELEGYVQMLNDDTPYFRVGHHIADAVTELKKYMDEGEEYGRYF